MSRGDSLVTLLEDFGRVLAAAECFHGLQTQALSPAHPLVGHRYLRMYTFLGSEGEDHGGGVESSLWTPIRPSRKVLAADFLGC